LEIIPFFPSLVKREGAHLVCSPPYDVVSEEEVLKIYARSPYTFLSVSRPEVFSSTDPYGYARIAFQKLKEELYYRLPKPTLLLYGIQDQDSVRLGVVGLFPLRDRKEGRILPHEKTRPDKVLDRLYHLKSLNASTGLVFLFYREDKELSRYLLSLSRTPPYVEVEDGDRNRHILWVLKEGEERKIQECFQKIDRLYIADGHHRCESALLYWEEKGCSSSPEGFFLGVAFPHTELKILPYHRFLDISFGERDDFLKKVHSLFPLKKVPPYTFPKKRRDIAFLLPEESYLCTLPDREGKLDVEVVQEEILAPYLKVENPATDPRLRFVGGKREREEFEDLFAQNRSGLGVGVYPVGVEELLRRVDEGKVLPPKSTWFYPKLLDGLFFYEFS
jgi:uncharacterized protein (DUF1015 family)